MKDQHRSQAMNTQLPSSNPIRGGTPRITGHVKIFKVRKGQRLLVAEADNRFVNAMLRGLGLLLICQRLHSVGPATTRRIRYWNYNWDIRVGDDIVTETTSQTNDLYGIKSGAPSVRSGENLSNPAPGVWEALWRGEWFPSSLVMDVGEIGLWLRPAIELLPWEGYGEYETSDTTVTPNQELCARLSVADEDFAVIPVTPDDGFQVDWTIRMAFE